MDSSGIRTPNLYNTYMLSHLLTQSQYNDNDFRNVTVPTLSDNLTFHKKLLCFAYHLQVLMNYTFMSNSVTRVVTDKL